MWEHGEDTVKKFVDNDNNISLAGKRYHLQIDKAKAEIALKDKSRASFTKINWGE